MNDIEKPEYKAFMQVIRIFLDVFPELQNNFHFLFGKKDIATTIASYFKNEEKRINEALYKIYKFLKTCYE